MLILIVVAVLAVAGCASAYLLRNTYGDWSIAGGFIGAAFTLVLAGLLVAIPIQRMNIRDGVRQFEAVRQTFNDARAADRGLELAAIQGKVADMNAWLASVQYWNHTAWDIWNPDEVDAIKPIR